MRCSAKSKRSGERCKKDAMVGKSCCHIHGGKSKSGAALPQFKDGRFSKALPERLAERFVESMRDARLVELRREIALTDARNEDVLSRVYSGESGSLWLKLRSLKRKVQDANRRGDRDTQGELLSEMFRLIERGASDAESWREIADGIERRRKLSESERRRLVEQRQVATMDELMALIGAITTAIKRNVKDPNERAAVGREVQRLLGADRMLGGGYDASEN